MNTTAEKYAKMVENTDAAVSYYLDLEGGRFILTFLVESLSGLLAAGELSSVTFMLKKFFDTAGIDIPEFLDAGDGTAAFAATQCVELFSELLEEQLGFHHVDSA